MRKRLILSTVVATAVISGYAASTRTLNQPILPATQEVVASPLPGTKQLAIQKSGIMLSDKTELSYFKWNNELHYLMTERNFNGTDMSMAIYKWDDQSLVATFGEDYGLGSAIVEGGTLHVFATKNPWEFGNGNAIYHFTSTDLTNWSNPVLIKQIPADSRAWNTSVVKNSDTGEFVVAYDYTGPQALKGFAQKFIKSSDLTNWSNAGTILGANFYAGCSYMYYQDGYYYIWHLASLKRPNTSTGVLETYYAPYLARTTNFSTFTHSRLFTIYPSETWEDRNTSDLDMIEHDGKVYISYMIGDQVTYARLTYATFEGTMAELIETYFRAN